MDRFVLLPNELQSMVMRYVPFPQACVFLKHPQLRDVFCRTLHMLDLDALKEHERSYVCKTLCQNTTELPSLNTLRLRTWRNPIKSLVLPQLHTITLYQADLSGNLSRYVLTLPHLHTLRIQHLRMYRPNHEMASLRRENAKAWLHITIGRCALMYEAHCTLDFIFLPMVASVFFADLRLHPYKRTRISRSMVYRTLCNYEQERRLRHEEERDVYPYTIWIREQDGLYQRSVRVDDGQEMDTYTGEALSPFDTEPLGALAVHAVNKKAPSVSARCV